MAYEEAFEEGKGVVEELEKEKKAKEQAASETPETPEDILQTLEKLGVLKEKGVLTEEEFEEQKQKLLDRL